jgi:hypothetical protein
VFRRGVPKAKTLKQDLARCNIPYQDEFGRRVDFHALRHTFNTNLQRVGVPPRVTMELMRHSDLRLSSNTYTDTTCLPIFDEFGKLNALLPSPNFDKICQNSGKRVPSEAQPEHAEIVPFTVKGNALGKAVRSWDNDDLAEREGFEPPPA